MNTTTEMETDYQKLLSFWNEAFKMDLQQKKEARDSIQPQDWGKMAPSEKLLQAVCLLSDRKRILDYGCGAGWAAIAAAKSGCCNVTGVDTAASAIEMAAFYAEIFNVTSSIDFVHISPNWLNNCQDNSFDGIICSNVLDVIIPSESEKLLQQFQRILASDGKIIIGMNHYLPLKEDKNKNITVKNENSIYIDGILRLVSRTDEQWKEIIEKYFVIESLQYFSWPKETSERRRLFVLKKKN